MGGMRDRSGGGGGGRPIGPGSWQRPDQVDPMTYGTPYLSGIDAGYFDREGYIRAELVTDLAEKAAQWLGHSRIPGAQSGLSGTQLRRFFNRVRLIEQQLDGAAGGFPEVRHRIAALKPLAAAAVGRRSAPDALKQFMDRNVALALPNPEAFRTFVEHFQAVIAYFVFHFRGR